MLTQVVKPRILPYQIEDLAAGVDIAARVIHRGEPGRDTVIRSGRLIFEVATVGVDGGNTLQIIAATPGGTVLDSTVLAANQAAGTVLLLTFTAANALLTSAQNLTLSVTQGANADAGRMILEVSFEKP